MPENETPVDVRWLVGIAGRDRELSVTAAYVWQQAAGTSEIILKDANHKIVFQGPREHVQYARRDQKPDGTVPAIYVPTPPGTTPSQIRELQDELNKAAGASPGRFIVLPPGSKVPQGAGAELLSQVLAGTPTIGEGRGRLAEHPWEIGEG